MADRQIGPVAKDLIAAKAMIADPGNWCREMFKNGHKRCAVGAFMTDEMMEKNPHMLTHEFLAQHENAIRRLKLSCFELYSTSNIYAINDNKGHEAVMAIYDHAINRAISERM